MKKLLAFLCLLAATSAPAQEQFPAIREIAVEGNRNTQRELIVNTLSLKAGEEYNSVKLQESIRSLYDLGLFSRIQADTTIGDSGLILAIRVKEFPVLDRYELSGNKKVREEDIKAKITLNEGQVLTDQNIQNIVRDLRDMYDKEGLLMAEIEANTVPSKENPNRVVLAIDIKEGKKVQVAQVHFQGVSKVKESKLRSLMKTKEDRWWRSGDFKEEDFEADVQAIPDFYREKGFLDARVLDYQIGPCPVVRKEAWKRPAGGKGIKKQVVVRPAGVDSLTPDQARSNLRIDVQVYEGPRFYAGRFSFEGNVLFKGSRLKKEVLLDEGDVFNQKRFDLLKFKLQSLYYEEGYIYSRFDEKRTYRGDTIDVHFNVTEGLPAYVHKIRIEGNLKTREKVIRREIALVPGSIFRQSKLERSYRNVMHLNFFTDVKYDIKPLDEGSVDIVFRVIEREDIGQVSVGVGYSQRDGVVGTASLSIPNFRGAGQKLDLNLERGSVKQNYVLGFSEPWMYDTPTSLGFRIFYTEQKYTNQLYLDRGAELSLGRKLRWPDDYFSVSGSYQFSREDVTGLSTAIASSGGRSVLSSGLRSSLSLRLLRDDTDLPQFPTRGSVFYYNPEFFGGPLGGDFSFTKHNLHLNWNFPAFWKFVLSTRAQLGYIDGTRISHYHLFKAGGVNYDGMIRGYPEGQFGGSLNNGLSMMAFSAAFRFPVIDQQLYLSLFADAGNTFGDLSTVDPTDLKRSAGAGIRLSIPMLGLMGFDAAYGFDPVDQFSKEPSGLNWHFQIGKGF